MNHQRVLTIVIKLGSSSICNAKTHEPLLSNLSLIVETVVRLRRDGHRVILVSSGAIAIGMRRLDIDKLPKPLAAVQAIAAVGQCRLIALWDELFKQLRQPVAQILLTRNDFIHQTQFTNAANTLSQLLKMGVIPIVNENDTLAVSEIKFGDNDTLSAFTAGMVHADYLFLMTDVDCLYDSNPRTNPDAKAIPVVEDISALQADVSEVGSSVGTGGMATKLIAAKLATSAGVTTIITRSSIPSNIFNIITYLQALKTESATASQSQSRAASRESSPPRKSNINITATDDPVSVSKLVTALHLSHHLKEPHPKPTLSRATSSTVVSIASVPTTLSYTTASTAVSVASLPEPPLHTRFLPKPRALKGRHFWILHGLKPHGILYIDKGAHLALTRTDKAGLLPVGIVHVEGTFAQQEAVSMFVVQRNENSTSGKGFDVLGEELGRAIVNYSNIEIGRIKGLQSSDIAAVLGYADTEYVADRDNTAFFPKDGIEQ